jgi:hypothetical protein
MKRILLLLSVLFTANVYAQDTGSGLDFLNISPTADQLSLSQAGSASVTGPAAIYSNPAQLAMAASSSVDLGYTFWIANVENQFAGINLLRNRSAFGFAVYSSGAGDFEARDRPGESSGNFSVEYLSLSGAFAYRTGPVSVGVTAQYLREEIFQYVANGYAFSVGAAARFLDERVRLGASVNNLGEMDELNQVSTPLPSTLNIGASAGLVEFTTPVEDDLPVLLTLHADWNKPLEERSGGDFTGSDDGDGFLSLALQADLGELFSLRGGYRIGPTERPVSFGMNFLVEPLRVQYAIVPFTTGYGTVHSLGIQYHF